MKLVKQNLGKVSVTPEGEWDINKSYPRLSVVYTDYYSYLSKKDVPAGTAIENEEYWQVLANTSGKGPKGDVGKEGPRGEQGLQGKQGEKGDTGEKGEKGDKGDQGNSGYTGAADELEIVNNLTDTRTTVYVLDKSISPVEGKEDSAGEIVTLLITLIDNNSKLVYLATHTLNTAHKAGVIKERILEVEDWLSERYGGGRCEYYYGSHELNFVGTVKVPYDFIVLVDDRDHPHSLDDAIYPRTIISVSEKPAALSSAMGKRLYDRMVTVTESEYQNRVNNGQIEDDVYYFIVEDDSEVPVVDEEVTGADYTQSILNLNAKIEAEAYRAEQEEYRLNQAIDSVEQTAENAGHDAELLFKSVDDINKKIEDASAEIYGIKDRVDSDEMDIETLQHDVYGIKQDLNNVKEAVESGGGSSTATDIPDGSISTRKIANGAVTRDKIQNNSVTDDKIANGSIITEKICSGAVDERCLLPGAVTSSILGSNAVTESKIADRAVTTDKIQNGSITTDKLADGAVTPLELAGNAVTNEKIKDGAVTTSKLANQAVTSEKVANSAITSSKIANKAVTADKLSDEVRAAISQGSGGGSVAVENDYAHDSDAFTGYGKITLDGNIATGNVLTQDMLSSENTRYVIKYDFDLDGETINVPRNCILDFQGGSFKNGTLYCDPATYDYYDGEKHYTVYDWQHERLDEHKASLFVHPEMKKLTNGTIIVAPAYNILHDVFLDGTLDPSVSCFDTWVDDMRQLCRAAYEINMTKDYVLDGDVYQKSPYTYTFHSFQRIKGNGHKFIYDYDSGGWRQTLATVNHRTFDASADRTIADIDVYNLQGLTTKGEFVSKYPNATMGLITGDRMWISVVGTGFTNVTVKLYAANGDLLAQRSIDANSSTYITLSNGTSKDGDYYLGEVTSPVDTVKIVCGASAQTAGTAIDGSYCRLNIYRKGTGDRSKMLFDYLQDYSLQKKMCGEVFDTTICKALPEYEDGFIVNPETEDKKRKTDYVQFTTAETDFRIFATKALYVENTEIITKFSADNPQRQYIKVYAMLTETTDGETKLVYLKSGEIPTDGRTVVKGGTKKVIKSTADKVMTETTEWTTPSGVSMTETKTYATSIQGEHTSEEFYEYYYYYESADTLEEWDNIPYGVRHRITAFAIIESGEFVNVKADCADRLAGFYSQPQPTLSADGSVHYDLSNGEVNYLKIRNCELKISDFVAEGNIAQIEIDNSVVRSTGGFYYFLSIGTAADREDSYIRISNSTIYGRIEDTGTTGVTKYYCPNFRYKSITYSNCEVNYGGIGFGGHPYREVDGELVSYTKIESVTYNNCIISNPFSEHNVEVVTFNKCLFNELLRSCVLGNVDEVNVNDCVIRPNKDGAGVFSQQEYIFKVKYNSLGKEIILKSNGIVQDSITKDINISFNNTVFDTSLLTQKYIVAVAGYRYMYEDNIKSEGLEGAIVYKDMPNLDKTLKFHGCRLTPKHRGTAGVNLVLVSFYKGEQQYVDKDEVDAKSFIAPVDNTFYGTASAAITPMYANSLDNTFLNENFRCMIRSEAGEDGIDGLYEYDVTLDKMIKLAEYK